MESLLGFTSIIPLYTTYCLQYLQTLTEYSVASLPPEHSTCPLCLEPFSGDDSGQLSSRLDTPVWLPCGHMVGKECLAYRLCPPEGPYNSCPVCYDKLFDKLDVLESRNFSAEELEALEHSSSNFMFLAMNGDLRGDQNKPVYPGNYVFVTTDANGGVAVPKLYRPASEGVQPENLTNVTGPLVNEPANGQDVEVGDYATNQEMQRAADRRLLLRELPAYGVPPRRPSHWEPGL